MKSGTEEATMRTMTTIDKIAGILTAEIVKEDFTRKFDGIPGGRSEDMTFTDVVKKHAPLFPEESFDDVLNEWEMGENIEKEHSPDKDIAKEIALDHLAESDQYYTDLAEMEQDYED